MKQEIIKLLNSLGNTSAEVAESLMRLNIKGKKNSDEHCPIANYIFSNVNLPKASNLYVLSYSVSFYNHEKSEYDHIPYDFPISLFIKEFDKGNHPLLEE